MVNSTNEKGVMDATRLKRAGIESINHYPFFIDYNFADSKPRGGSAFIDFFAGGGLCSLMDGLGKDGLVYVKKDKIEPAGGFFLMDFAKVKAEPESFIKAVSNLHLDRLYVEDSRRYSLNDVLHDLGGVSVTLVSFVP